MSTAHWRTVLFTLKEFGDCFMTTTMKKSESRCPGVYIIEATIYEWKPSFFFFLIIETVKASGFQGAPDVILFHVKYF